MAVFGEQIYTKKELIARLGNISSLVGIKSYTLNHGKGEGIQAFDVTTGSGMEFTVMASRCMDILSMKYKGIPLNFIGKPGVVSAAHADTKGNNFTRNVTGGMLYTCGLSNVGLYYSDEKADHPFHGRLRYTPAENICYETRWEDNEYLLRLSGEMRETAIFGDNISFKRCITTKLGEKSIQISDCIENEGFEKQPFMLMYHINAGFPLLDKDICVYIPTFETLPMNEAAETHIKEYAEISEPQEGYSENVFIHKLYTDNDGRALTGLYNEKLKMGLCIEYSNMILPFLLQWKSMSSGDYALGLQPTNCYAQGRAYETKMNHLKYIEPFEKIICELKITVIDGEIERKKFLERLKEYKYKY
jgi:hypothetical protein